MPAQGIRSRLISAALWPISGLLKTGDEHVTIDRLFDSKHVRDLQLIIAFSFTAVVLLGCIGALVVAHTHMQLDAAAVKCVKYGAPVLVAFGGVVSWAYKTGSSRLGVVDLFACEISTLCRVAAVAETVHQCVCRVDHPTSEDSIPGNTHVHAVQQFTSAEEYFPVFASNNPALQALEAPVVINITAFYTYMKTFRDSLRALAQISVAPTEANPSALRAWHTAATNAIYMLFLGLESARKAIADLVEFDPEQAERTIVVLLSELEAFQFLRQAYPEKDDVYHERIELRVPDYTAAVNHLRKVVTDQKDDPDWKPAYLLLDKLGRRYSAAIPEFPLDGPPERSRTAHA